MMKTKLLFYLFIFLVISKNLMAQDKSACSNALYQANKEYEAGHFSQVLELLRPCLKNGFTTDEKFEAYRLMSLCYIYLTQSDSAKWSAAKMLKQKPSYQKFPYVDPLDFTRLLEAFEVRPKLEFGISAGMNSNNVKPINNFSVSGSPASFLTGTGFQIGGFFEYFPTSKISIVLGCSNENLKYSRKADDVNGWEQTYAEELNLFAIPLSLRYLVFNSKSLRIYPEIGFQAAILSSASANIVMLNSNDENIQTPIDRFTQRNKLNKAVKAGVQLKYKLGPGDAGFNVSYANGLNNIVIPKRRYDNLEFILGNQYIDSDFKFNTFYYTFSYQFPLFYSVKTKKIKS